MSDFVICKNCNYFQKTSDKELGVCLLFRESHFEWEVCINFDDSK